MNKRSRRFFIKSCMSGGIIMIAPNILTSAAQSPRPATPSETEGPFYPVNAQKDKDFDLTLIKGKNKSAKGRVIWIHGKVLDAYGNPLENVQIELWQANADGKYNHPRDKRRAPIDPYFQGWAIVPSGKGGEFRFKTIYPGAYPAGPGWTRPPHIHFKFQKNDRPKLTTQMYFPNHALNKTDYLLQQKTKQQQALMIAKQNTSNTDQFEYIVTLA